MHVKLRSAPFRLSLSLAIASTASVRAQRPDGDGAHPPSPDTAAQDTFVDDSFEAREQVDRLNADVDAGDWVKASRRVDDLFARHASRLVAVGAGRFESTARYLNRVVAGWPPQGLAVYRELFDDPAENAYRDALKSRDADALLRVFDRYFCTTPGPRIAEAASELLMESGDFDAARRVALRVPREHPDGDTLEAGWTARLAVIAALQGDENEADRRLARHAEIQAHGLFRWMGRDRPLAPLVHTLSSQVRAERDRHDTSDWPVFGGDNTRNKFGEFVFDRMALLWRFDAFTDGSPGKGAAEHAFSTTTTTTATNTAARDAETGKSLSLNPVVGGGKVFFQDADDVWAVESRTGTQVWHHHDADGSPSGTAGDEGAGAAWYAPTYHGNRLYACLGEEVVPYYGYESTARRSAVLCLDAETGTPIWRVDPLGAGPGYAKVSYGASPLVDAGGVYVVSRRRRTFGFEDGYLLRLRASDGSPVYRTHLGGASTGGFGYRRSTLAIPALVDGTVYVLTNLGSVAAVAARTGLVQWLRLYERTSEEQWRSGIGTTQRSVLPWHYNPVLCDGDRLICRPMDASAVFVLDRRDGRLLRRVSADRLAGAVTLFGVAGGRLYGAGVEAFCYDLDGDAIVWRSALPAGARTLGRGVLAGGHVLVPTDRGLCAFDTGDGTLAVQPWRGHAAGNLLAVNQRLLVAGADHIVAYARRADVWARLRKRMAEHPDDPVPALELSEIAFRSDDRDEALRLLDQAVERAGGFAGIAGARIGGRFFKDCIRFAESAPVTTDRERSRVERLFTCAGQCAPDRAAHVRYRFLFAAFLTRYGDVARAVTLYQQILTDESLRETPWGEPADEDTAGRAARRLIE